MSKFVWHDLMTSDVDGAKGFYGELFGWNLKKDEKSPYTLIDAGGKHFGGMLPFNKPGVPPHWIGYISTENLDKTIEHIGQHGGKIRAPKQAIPNVGNFAVGEDPTGGLFVAFQDAHDTKPVQDPEKPAAGTFCWNELLSTDPDAAAKFYHHVFGWTTTQMDMGEHGKYTLFNHHHHKRNVAGMMKLPAGVPATAWLHYVAVDDADATAEKAKKLGGTVPMPVTSVPDVGRFCPIMDKQGAAFAILGPNK